MTDPPEILTLWRMVSPQYAHRAFSGEGAEKFGARFNSKGRKLVYASGSLSLAILEALVQTNSRERLKNHVCISAEVRSDFVLSITPEDLPAGWNNRPFDKNSQVVGDAWIEKERSLVLRVPSVVNPHEFNYLINPLHPDFDSLKIGKVIPAPVDSPRLIE